MPVRADDAVEVSLRFLAIEPTTVCDVRCLSCPVRDISGDVTWRDAYRDGGRDSCSGTVSSRSRSSPALSVYSTSAVPAESRDILPGLYAAFASVVLFALVTAVFVGATTVASVALAVSAISSGAIGFFTVGRGLARPLRGTRQFARPWLWFAVWAAIGLYDGRYQPLIVAAALAAAMCVCYLVGGGLAAWRRRHGTGTARP
ncbi:MAG: hypothetical protein ABI880_01270 [Acidobacteriota bacterium]